MLASPSVIHGLQESCSAPSECKDSQHGIALIVPVAAELRK
jgi:hypothetical protein